MKVLVALSLVAGGLFLTGCSTAPQSSKWEYKLVREPDFVQSPEVVRRPDFPDLRRQYDEAFLNNLGKQGWIYIKTEGEIYYFKRPVK
jgi:hypothetical protein